VSTNLNTILGGLRDAAPKAEIIVTGAWDSFIGAFDVADPLFQLLNASMAQVAAANLAWFADSCAPRMTAIPLMQALADIVFNVSGYARLLE
jgi:hypothetical protein